MSEVVRFTSSLLLSFLVGTTYSEAAWAALPPRWKRHSFAVEGVDEGAFGLSANGGERVDFHLWLMPSRVTVHSEYINIVHYLFQASLVLRCILPFSLVVQQVSV